MSEALSAPPPEASAEAPASTEAPAAPGALRKLALKGSFYEILSFGGSQVVRLGGNLLLTRLLFPEAFGMSAMIAIFNQGLVMLSDVGVAPGVVQSPQGDDVRFLNTAWTMHVVRGTALFLIALLLAWPMGWLYHEPELGPLLAVGSLTVLVGGFESTSLMTLRRRVDARRGAMIDLGSQIVSLAATIAAAWFTRSVWALVIGSLIGQLLKTLASHFIDVGYKNRFEWSPEAARAIVGFGRWIFLSSAVAFAAGQADRVFLGKLLGFAELGVYSVAINLADAGAVVGTRLTHQVLFPIFSRVHNEQTARLRDVYYRARLALDSLILPAAGAMFVFAPRLIDLMYDDRYIGAGWMLRVLVLRLALSSITTPCENCLFSMGHSQYGFTKSVIRTFWMIIGLPLGYHLYGLTGFVWVTAMAELPALVLLLTVFHKKGLLLARRELLVLPLFGLGAAAAALLSLLLP